MSENQSPPTSQGVLEWFDKNREGRLRTLDKTLEQSAADPVVPQNIIERFRLRPGVCIEVELGAHVGKRNGQQQRHQRNQRGKRGRNQRNRKTNMKQPDVGPGARRVENVVSIDGMTPDQYAEARLFDDLTSIDPQPRLTLEYPGCPPACRLIDLFCPIGYGQRGMIVSPPKAGKTTLLQQVAFAIEKNHPEVEVIALLLDERPEEVTDFRRNVPCKVWASSNDHDVKRHVSLGQIAIDRAKRLAEEGRDVVVLLDSLTRLGRAFNVAPGVKQTGRTMSGGLDSSALAIPKQLFGAARKFEEGGSLTIIATALVDTGSRADQIIFEEFKGTGNMELILDRKIADHRLFPAINLAASGTRKEHLMIDQATLNTVTALRRRLLNMQPTMQIEQLLKAMEKFETNADLVGNPQSPATA